MEFTEISKMFVERNEHIIRLLEYKVISYDEAESRMSEHWWMTDTVLSQYLNIDQTHELNKQFNAAEDKLCKMADSLEESN